MRTCATIILLVGIAALPCGASSQEFRIEEVPSVTAVPIGTLKPKTIVFNDHRNDEVADPVSKLIRFEDWARVRPSQKEFLSLYPRYAEPTINITRDGATKPVTQKLHLYVAEARFVLTKPPASINLPDYATLSFLERIDPAIKHTALSPENAAPLKDPAMSYQRHPERAWCAAKPHAICIQSRYRFEGKLPTAILLANKLREYRKKIADHLEFQSELRLLSRQEIDSLNLPKITKHNAAVTGALEQNIFWVNQLIQFGKFLAVFQEDPASQSKTIVTAFMALAIHSDVLEKRKEYEQVPVLRNLMPAQVLAGNSSFNTGNSISAGLPIYVRNQIKAVAEILERQ
jgi:hypothetical protein